MTRLAKSGKSRRTPQAQRAGQSPDAGLPAEPGQRRLPRRLITLGLCLLSAILLNLSFAPFDAWFLGYVALVPWVIGLALAPSRRWGLFSAWLGGLIFWAAALYWLTWITMLGYIAGVLYVSLYWLVAAAILWAALKRNQPMFLALPLVWVSLEFIRANAQSFYLGPTFPWFELAHSQYRRTVLIQLADITGAYGLSFILAMANGLIADAGMAFIRRRRGRGSRTGGQLPIMPAIGEVRSPRRRLIVGSAVLAGALAGTIGYGTWQLSRHTQKPGPVIGIVQRAYPISLEGRTVNGHQITQEDILDSHLAGTRKFLGSKIKPDLVIWPETMLPAGLNREVIDQNVDSLKGDVLRGLAAKFAGPQAWDPSKSESLIRSFLHGYLQDGLMDANGVSEPSLRQLADEMYAMSAQLGCPILAGGSTIYRNAHPLFPKDDWLVRNGALWFDPNDPNAPSYAKRHLVPFSEYVPFKHTWLGLYLFLRRFVPDAMEQLDPGPKDTRFVLARPGGTWRVVSPICYEGTIAPLCREMVYQDGRKRADIMANLSNDGWFVCPLDGDKASTEQAEHLSHYCFRAVENRVPVVRAVNTGISASIDSDGRIVAEIRSGGRNTMISGTLLLDGARRNAIEYLPGHGPKVLVDERISWYSRIGNAFAWVVVIVTAAWAAGMFIVYRRRKEGLGN